MRTNMRKNNRKNVMKKFAATALCILAATSAVPTLTAYASPRRHNASSSARQDSQNIKSVAKKIQKAFDQKNLDALSELCKFPLAIVYDNGDNMEFKDKRELAAFGSDAIFTQTLRDAIAATNVAGLEDGDFAGVWMGNDFGLNMFKFNGQWKINSIVLEATEGSGGFNIANAPDAALIMQKVFYYRDLDSLSRICNYPLAFTFANGTTKEISSPAELIALGENKIFTDKLLKAIDQAQLETVGNSGYQLMGGNSGLNMYQFGGYWKINQIIQ